MSFTYFSFDQFLKSIRSTFEPLCKTKGIGISIQKNNNVPKHVFCDEEILTQIVSNILSNAVKFTEKGSISFEFLENKYNWEFYIKDTGIGIAEKDFEIIFKDFKRVKSPYVDSMPGSGLGLSLTKRIIQLHGGNISFTSKLGKGSTFIFNIPKKIKNIDSYLGVKG